MLVCVLFLSGVAEALHAAACIILDKGDKLPREVVQEQLQSLLVDSTPASITELLNTVHVSELRASIPLRIVQGT